MALAPQRPPAGEIVLTYEDYAVLPDDGRRYQILDGALDVTPAPSTVHQGVSRNLQRILDRHVEARRLGVLFNAPIDVILGPTNIVQPDLLFVAAGREDIITRRAVEGAPDLIVEILSPASTRNDTVVKASVYARFGVRHYWIVDPDARSLEMHELAGTAYRLANRIAGTETGRSTLFPGLEIDLARIWPDLPREGER